MQLHEKRQEGYFIKKLFCNTPHVTEICSEVATINSFLPQEAKR